MAKSLAPYLRPLEAAWRYITAVQGALGRGTAGSRTLPALLEHRAAAHPERICLRYRDRSFSYAEANACVNRLAGMHRRRGVCKGDVVALWMENRPEYLWHLLALGKLGAVISLINTNLSGEALRHALEVTHPRGLIVGSELWQRYGDVRPLLSSALRDGTLVDVDPDAADVDTGTTPIAQQLSAGLLEENPPETATHDPNSIFAHIYTSGTTGLPKAAVVRHERFIRAGHAWGGLVFRFGTDDVLYVCLPLYHSNGLLLGAGSALSAGATLALARKFSASQFWEDIRAHRATHFIYIGELCRYLLNAPPSPHDRDHSVRIISGNGLRSDVWRPFQQRFGISRIVEFYGSTEGTHITFNSFGVVGAVGPFVPYAMRIAAWDEDSQDFLRDAAGHLVQVKAGEPGVLLFRVRSKQAFAGYTNRTDSERKMVRDAFKAGDAWFNTGDLMKRQRGFLYFVDRLGDTFRWKGENVSTTEVQEQLSVHPPLAQVDAYGVQVTGTEGRAGMVALVLKDGTTSFEPDAFAAHVERRVPAYARPVFVRVCSQLDQTGTFKVKKNVLQAEGFDPRRIADPLFYWHPHQRRYVPLDVEAYETLMRGDLRL